MFVLDSNDGLEQFRANFFIHGAKKIFKILVIWRCLKCELNINFL